MTVTCGYCDQPALLQTGAELHPHLTHIKGMAARHYWVCKKCESYVGCHPAEAVGQGGVGDGTVPYGTLAKAPRRLARQAAHDAFDKLWRRGFMHRQDAYAWLARTMRVPPEQAHIGHFTEDQCWELIEALEELSKPRLFARLVKRPAQPPASPG